MKKNEIVLFETADNEVSLQVQMQDDYDHKTMVKPKGNDTIYTLTYEECRDVIDKTLL